MAIILILLGIIGGVLAILAGYLVVTLGWIFQIPPEHSKAERD